MLKYAKKENVERAEERLRKGEQDVPSRSSRCSYYCRILLLTLQCFDFFYLLSTLVVLLLLTDGSNYQLL
jgi:hypothetical protein